MENKTNPTDLIAPLYDNLIKPGFWEYENIYQIGIMEKYLHPKSTILNIGAGIVRLTIPLIQEPCFYKVIVVEHSVAMYKQLTNKVTSNELTAFFKGHNGFINTLKIEAPINLAFAFWSVLNYITTEKQMQIMFDKVYNFLY
jgi:hypothetical protein